MVRLSGEGRGWLVAGVALAAAWGFAGVLVRIEIGPMDNPDDFSPFPPLSALVAAVVLLPATATFVALGIGRAAYLGWIRLGRHRAVDPHDRTG